MRMEASVAPAFLKETLIVLGAAAIVIPLFHRLRLSSVLGFLLTGMAVGPFGFGRLAANYPALSVVTIPDPNAIAPIARLGVVLLLFMIGLELSFERLLVMRKLVFGLGSLQVAASAFLLAAIARALGCAPAEAATLGLAGAMSSTAIVIQVLSEEKRLMTPMGRAGLSVLLFQDLAVVPILFAIRMLATGVATASPANIAATAGGAVVAVIVIVALGRLLLRPLFRSVARTQSPELFMAACLLVVFAAALITARAGLSMALGALLGGLLLAETEYRRQVEITIEPFKGLFVGVFLISVGMGFNFADFLAMPVAIAVAILGLMAVKSLVITVAARGFGLPWQTGLQVGLLLAPAGEFGFVLLGVATSQGLLSRERSELALIVAVVTMAAIPLLSKLGQSLASRPQPAVALPSLPNPPVSPGVIIAGFGRVGQTVAAMLERHQIPYVAIDRDADRVQTERTTGKPIYYGDITRIELLRRFHIDAARALVVTLDDRRGVDDLVSAARAERRDLLIVARARDAAHAAHLYRTGASDAVPETVEASLQLAEALLIDIGIPAGPVIASIHEQRATVQSRIKAMAPEAEVRRLGARRLRDAAR
jgi:monovalent cation:H+ antiporter-2, CPA2 family